MSSSEPHNCVAVIADRLFKPRQAITYLPDGSVTTTPLMPGQRVDHAVLSPADRAALARVDGFDVATREYVNTVAKKTVDFVLASGPRSGAATAAPTAGTSTNMVYAEGKAGEAGVDFFTPAGVALPAGCKLLCMFLNASRAPVTKHEVVLTNLLTGDTAAVFSAPDSPGATTRSRRIKMSETISKDTVVALSVKPAPLDEAGAAVELSMQLVIQLPA